MEVIPTLPIITLSGVELNTLINSQKLAEQF